MILVPTATGSIIAETHFLFEYPYIEALVPLDSKREKVGGWLVLWMWVACKRACTVLWSVWYVTIL